MFILTKFQDLIQVAPHEFHMAARDIIEDKINEKYANKVVQKVGLCICMWDLSKSSDGLIGYGTGNANMNVEFRLLVFRPFKGEIIAARVKYNTPEGIYLSTEFFDNILVPDTMLFEGSYYNEEEQTWVWKTEDSEVFFDNGTTVHARIEKEIWEDTIQPNPVKDTALTNGASQEVAKKNPYSIVASMNEVGLGGSDWW